MTCMKKNENWRSRTCCGYLRTLAMPADTNQNGDIFGGWLLGQMDIGGGIFSSKVADGRTVTVAVDGMTFRKPVYVGDVVSVYADLIRSVRPHLQCMSKRG